MRSALTTIGLSFCFLLLWVVSISSLFNFLITGHLAPLPPPTPEITLYAFVSNLLIAPLSEELLFRKAPLDFFKNYTTQQKLSVVIVVSALFGWIHGGMYKVFFQGMMGYVWSRTYLKHGYWASVVSHSLWNLWAVWGWYYLSQLL